MKNGEQVLGYISNSWIVAELIQMINIKSSYKNHYSCSVCSFRQNVSHEKNFKYWNIKNIITLQESVNHIMMNNQTETSSPMPNQDITSPTDLSNPTKPASAIRADAVRGVN